MLCTGTLVILKTAGKSYEEICMEKVADRIEEK